MLRLRLLSCLLGTALALAAAPTEGITAPTPPRRDARSTIERLDPALDALLAPDAVIEVLAEGFTWSEGPVWVPAQGALLFSDVPENRIYRWREGEGVARLLEPSGFTGTVYRGRERGSNGLALDGQGRLVLCQHGDRRVARLAADGRSFETIVDQFEGKKFSSPNDLCFDRAGNLFFTDPPYGLPADTKPETAFNGIYRLSPDGKLTVIGGDMARPNGVALSPDERTLYVGSTDGAEPWVRSYALRADGTVASSGIFFDGAALLRAGRRGGFDGLRVDARGNVWATGPGGVLIISPQGRHLGSILTQRATANVAFGGPAGRTLFITADEALLRVRTLVGADPR